MDTTSLKTWSLSSRLSNWSPAEPAAVFCVLPALWNTSLPAAAERNEASMCMNAACLSVTSHWVLGNDKYELCCLLSGLWIDLFEQLSLMSPSLPLNHSFRLLCIHWSTRYLSFICCTSYIWIFYKTAITAVVIVSVCVYKRDIFDWICVLCFGFLWICWRFYFYH